MEKDKCLEVHLHDLFGRPVQLTSREIFTILFHPQTLLFIAIATIAFVAFDALGFQARVTVPQSAVIWAAGIPSYIFLYIGLVLLWGLGQRRFRLFAVYMPVLGFLALFLNFHLTSLHLSMYVDAPISPELLTDQLIYGFFLALIFEALFFAFVFPLAQARLLPHRPSRLARCITAAGQTFALEDILLLKGQEHYVQVVTTSDEFRLRARLSDLVSQTETADGVQAHRSYWVAKHAIANVVTENGNDILVLTNGARLAVARPRRNAVRAWIEEHVS